jgi:hypothetical protein
MALVLELPRHAGLAALAFIDHAGGQKFLVTAGDFQGSWQHKKCGMTFVTGDKGLWP